VSPTQPTRHTRNTARANYQPATQKRKTSVPMASNNTKIAPKDDAAPEKKNKKTTTKNTKTDKGDIKKRALEMLGKCCVRPKECKTRVLKDINGETGPISKCYKRWEVFENVLSVLSVSLLGASFFFSWVILRTTTFSYGQPMPMHIPGGCSKFCFVPDLCVFYALTVILTCDSALVCDISQGKEMNLATMNEEELTTKGFCKDVLFTFNVAPQKASDGSHRTNTSTESTDLTAAFKNVWKETQWWDVDAPRSGNDYNGLAIAGAASIKQDQLKVTGNVESLVDAINAGGLKYLQFSAKAPANPLYDGKSTLITSNLCAFLRSFQLTHCPRWFVRYSKHNCTLGM